MPLWSLLKQNPGHAAAFSYRALLQSRYELVMKGVTLDGWRAREYTAEGAVCLLALGHCGVAAEAALQIRDALPFVAEGAAKALAENLRRLSRLLSPGEERAIACALKAGGVLRGPLRRGGLAAPERLGPPVEITSASPGEVEGAGPDAYEATLEEAVDGGCAEMAEWILSRHLVGSDWAATVLFLRAVRARRPAISRRVLAAARRAGAEPPPEALAELEELEGELRWRGPREAWVAATIRAPAAPGARPSSSQPGAGPRAAELETPSRGERMTTERRSKKKEKGPGAVPLGERPALQAAVESFVEANSNFESTAVEEALLKELAEATALQAVFETALRHRAFDMRTALLWALFLEHAPSLAEEEGDPPFAAAFDAGAALRQIGEVYDRGLSEAVATHFGEEEEDDSDSGSEAGGSEAGGSETDPGV